MSADNKSLADVTKNFAGSTRLNLFHCKERKEKKAKGTKALHY